MDGSILILCLLEVIVVTSGKIRRLHGVRDHAICTVYGYKLVEAKFGDETHLLCLKLKPIGAFHQAAVILDPESEDFDEVFEDISLANLTMAHGFPIEESVTGSAEGYIGDDHNFYGVLHIGNRTLYADPYGKDNPSKNYGEFNCNLNILHRPRRSEIQVNRSPPFKDHKRTRGVAPARICELLLLADKLFFEKDANASLQQAVRRMVHAVAQADVIFRNSDFDDDGMPDNIGFSVKYILVLSSNETNERVFGNLMKNKIVDGNTYLMKFARLRRLSEVCLGVAFTGHAFSNRTLGLSFTSLGGGLGAGAAGGICDRRAFGLSFNTLVVSHATLTDERVPERLAALTLAHEMGHSFGAQHDDDFPGEQCHGYLMGSQSSESETGKSQQFSVCSKRLISTTLSSMSYCLVEENIPYCGNGIVEKGEACDCGLPSGCGHKDPCCTPRSGGALVFEEGALHKDGCSVSPKADCHPSQGPCCTASCQYANMTPNGIDCTKIDQECICEYNTTSCRCGLGGYCMVDGSCQAAECASLGFEECQCSVAVDILDSAIQGSNKCGVCCKLPGAEPHWVPRCVTAERAARLVLRKTRSLPANWPDQDYRGPNITTCLCYNDVCLPALMRAWREGASCVSLNQVGRCENSICWPSDSITPRLNVFPDVLSVKLTYSSNRRKFSGSSAYRAKYFANTLPFIIVMYVIQ